MVDKQLKVSGLQLMQWRNQAVKSAIAFNVPPAEVDWLLMEVAGLDRLSLRLGIEHRSQIQLQLPLLELEKLWQQRLHDRLPVQYITGVTPWRRFKIAVSPRVLIPRPETECLIDLALKAVADKPQLQQGNWADLGTGSGAIALGLAEVFPLALIHAVDCSPFALKVAQANANNSPFANRIHFYQGSWWQPLEFIKGSFSGIISNPPYIPTNTITTLQPEVVQHEPHLALDGGFDGLDCIRHLINTSPPYLQPGGVWLIEMMAGQSGIVRELLEQQGSYCNIQMYPDLAGIERFAQAYKTS